MDSRKNAINTTIQFAAWCFGAGGDWRRWITPIVQKVIDPWKARNPRDCRPAASRVHFSAQRALR
jgi:hypothetical protein